MKFTRFVSITPMLAVGFLGCTQTETTISVNVRYWTDYVDSATLAVKLEKNGETPVQDSMTPRFQGKVDQEIDVNGQTQIIPVDKYDVVCDHTWELAYCRYIKRFSVSWEPGEVTATLSGTAIDGMTLVDAAAASGDKVVNTFDLAEHEVNVVYFQLANTKARPTPPHGDVLGHAIVRAAASSDTAAPAASVGGGADSTSVASGRGL